MQPHEIKCAIVGRMYRDNIVLGRQIADVDTVLTRSVPADARADGKREIDDYMAPDPDCPVIVVSRGVIALEPDEGKIRAYLQRYCESRSDLPPGMREEL